jgi:integrase/recombinase XerD
LNTDELSKINGLITAESFTLDELVDLFINDCRVKDLRQATEKYYRNEIHAYAKFLREQGVDPHPANVTPGQIKENLIIYSEDVKKLKPVTINSRLRALKAFFNFLKDNKYIRDSPMEKIVQLKHRKEIIQTFSKRQIKDMFNKPNLRTFTGVRDLTIMMLMLEIGVRVNELINIDVYDIKLDDAMVHVRKTKGYNERMLPIQSDMREQLKKYLRIREDSGTDALFITIDGTRISKRQVQNRIKIYGNECQIKGVRCSPHTFRHTFAKMSVQNGAGIFDLQYMLGHTSMEMVRVYVNMFGSDVREKHREFSPLRNLRR